ncbi:MAG: hypothetical protein WKG07_27800 [Hymenobacter sp.]
MQQQRRQAQKRRAKGLGNAEGMGICHSYTEDGRCVSLLKILLTNHCIFDCAYCVSRRSNDVKRAAFTVDEVVDLTINFYRRNYIEGLFLSSGIFSSPDYTMERLVRIVKKLRTEHKFNGYIHVKTIPGASPGADSGSRPVRRPPEREHRTALGAGPAKRWPRKKLRRDSDPDGPDSGRYHSE